MIVIRYTDITNIEKDPVMDTDVILDYTLIYNKEISEVEVDDFISTGNFKLLSKWNIEDWATMEANTAKHLEDTKEVFKQKIIDMTDEKQSKAEFIISGKVITSLQRDRYKVKMKHAINVLGVDTTSLDQQALVKNITTEELMIKSEEFLQSLADSNGMTLLDYANLIVTTGNSWEDAVDEFSLLIETVKGRAYDVLDTGDISKLVLLLSDANKLGKTTDETLTANDILVMVRTQVQDIINKYTV